MRSRRQGEGDGLEILVWRRRRCAGRYSLAGRGSGVDAESALIIAGTADPVVPYAGGQVRLFDEKGRGEVIPVADSASFWRRLDDLPDIPHVTAQLPHASAGDPTRATLTQWGEDGPGRRVLLLTISGGGHVEPSVAHRVGALYTHLLGHQNGDVESAELAWRLFRDQRKP